MSLRPPSGISGKVARPVQDYLTEIYNAITQLFGQHEQNASAIRKLLPAAPAPGTVASPLTPPSLAVALGLGVTNTTDLTNHAIVLGGGAASIKAGPLGTTTTVLHGNAAADPTYSKVDLTADVSGVLPSSNGGTDNATYAVGDLLVATAATTLARLADIAVGSVLLSGGVATSPLYGKVDLTTAVTGVLPAANGGTAVAYNRVADTIVRTNQGADIGATNFSNVVTPGTYRVSYSLLDTAADVTAGAVTLTIGYTDDAGAATKTATQVLTGTGRSDGVAFLQAASGNVTWAVSHTGLFGTAKYALYICFERLS